MSSCDGYGTQCIDTGKQLTADSVAFDDSRIESGCASVQCVLDKTIETGRDHVEDKDNPHEVDISQIPHALNDHIDASFPTPLDGQVITYVEASNAFEAITNPAGVTDHLLLSNIGTNTHVIIDEHIADITQNPHQITAGMVGAEPANSNIQEHIADVTTNPHAVTYQNIGGTPPPQNPTGYKNAIINGRLGPAGGLWIINQRGFNGDWAALASGYGYDRWAKNNSTDIIQLVEEGNVIRGETYTLSWEGGGVGYFSTDPQDPSTASPFIGIISSSTLGVHTDVVVPIGAFNIQLELGSNQTDFEIRPIGLELQLCQRYYIETDALSASAFTVGRSGTAIYHSETFPVPMLKVPTVVLHSTFNDAADRVYNIDTAASITVTGLSVGRYGIRTISLATTPALQDRILYYYKATAEIT